MTSQPCYQTMSIHISNSKGNQVTKFGQLIKYNMRNIFLQKSYSNFGGETIPKTSSKRSN